MSYIAPTHQFYTEVTEFGLFEDKNKVQHIAKHIPFYYLVHKGLIVERELLEKAAAQTEQKIDVDLNWPDCFTRLNALIEQRDKGHDIRVMTDEEKELFSNANFCGVSTGLTPHNIRPRYDFVSETDAYKQKRDKRTLRIRGETETELAGQCKKHFEDKANMSNGALVANCLQHRQTFLHSSLKQPESVDNYFSVLLMYYPGLLAPSDLVTDNPCNLQPYLMYREPRKFQNTGNHSDIFHEFSGHACGPLYSSRYLKQCSSAFSTINTSLIESNNKLIQRMNISAIWMNLDTFNMYLDLILDIQNRQVIRKQEGKRVF